MNYYFCKDNQAAERNSVGVLFVTVAHVEPVLCYCDEYDTFWKGLNNGNLTDVVQITKPHLTPATLTEIAQAGWLADVDGISAPNQTLIVHN